MILLNLISLVSKNDYYLSFHGTLVIVVWSSIFSQLYRGKFQGNELRVSTCIGWFEPFKRRYEKPEQSGYWVFDCPDRGTIHYFVRRPKIEDSENTPNNAGYL